MKKIVYRLTMLILVTLGFQSCEDLDEITNPNFDVAFNATAKVGEPVEFKISNAPDFLSFFSGETSREFRNSNRLKADGTFSLSFDTARHYFDGASRSDNAWNLLVSTDYTGSGKVEDVQAATWTDITDRFTFATARTYSQTNSGTVDISDLASDLPTYFAIRVNAEGKKSEGNRQGVFRLHSFDISLAVENENYSLDVTTITNPGFKPVNVEGTHPSNKSKDLWVNKGGYFEMSGDQAEYTNDDWLISRPINLSGAVEPDRGEPLKSYTDILKSFQYIYSEAGTYSVVFVGSNETIHGQKDSMKEFTITVTD
ncbi:DUF5017 domain-containing protein [Polaribacter sp. IC073]|uniref:DUF5017 domain-containing protein n=1 Tax=Polaribacter sp. IC073 TaxID=2508540 RepID=UPI001676BA92|nr:DUF5017 domain-containing protein [Polaribacter sp. IC073]